MAVDSRNLLNDKWLAEAIMKTEELSNSDVVFALRNFLKLKYYPVAIKFFFSEEKLEDLKKNAEYRIGMRPFTFCHYVAASRQMGDVLLMTEDKLGCSNAKYVFGWKEFDEKEINAHLKYAKDEKQAEMFAKTKKRLPEGLKAIATSPLHKAPYKPDAVYIVCDVLQAYHMIVDWCAAFNKHPFQSSITVNSAACHVSVASFLTNYPNLHPMCPGSYTSGKTEQGEINLIFPKEQIKAVVGRALERVIRDGGVSLPRTGETYPGFDVCKLCSVLIFPKPKAEK